MKRILTIVAFMLAGVLCFAQGRKIDILEKAAGQRISFNYTYSLDKGDGMQEVTTGVVTAEGNCFVLTGLGLKTWSDGTTCWMVDEEAKEVVIDNIAKDDIFTNPALMVSSYRNFSDDIKVNKEGSDYLDFTLKLDDDMTLRFVLKGIRISDPVGVDEFTLDTSALGSSYVITDLR